MEKCGGASSKRGTRESVERGFSRYLIGACLLCTKQCAMCLIVQERLVKVVEEKQLLVEEQGGFRRGRGCRILSLSLLGQTMITRRRDVGCIY